MIIDFHTHFYPAKVAEKAMAHCQGVLNVYFDGTRHGLLESMGEANVDLSVGLALVNNPENAESINNWAIRQHHDAVCMLGSIHPRRTDSPEQIRQIALGDAQCALFSTAFFGDAFPFQVNAGDFFEILECTIVFKVKVFCTD